MKLEDIPKKNAFKVPEGYFDELPQIIQSRIAKKEAWPAGIPSFRWAWRYALPVLAVCLALFFLLRPSGPGATPEELLASVDEEALATYLMESDLTTEELLDMASLDEADINALNGQLLPGLDADALEEYVIENEL